MKSFVEKYKPQKIDEIPQEIETLRKLIEEKQHILIHGPTGSCKTSAIYAIAEELDYEILEMNASDFRKKDQVESKIGSASQQQSLFNKEKILLIDEVDCLSGREDRGGAPAIVRTIKNSKFPIILTANDINSDKIKEIKKQTSIVEFKPIVSREIVKVLKNICKKEEINYTEENLRQITINSGGDIRAAINELQGSIINNEIITLEEQRNYEKNIVNVLNKIFKTKDFDSHRIMENTNLNLDEYSLWLDENLPLEYETKDLHKAYDLVSKADIMKGRIRRWQYWRLMYYQNLLLTSGISIIKDKVNKNFSKYKRSMRPLKIWQSNIRNAKKKSIAEKIAKHTHTSIKNVIKNFNYYKNILKNEKILEKLKLEQDEIEYLNKI